MMLTKPEKLIFRELCENSRISAAELSAKLGMTRYTAMQTIDSANQKLKLKYGSINKAFTELELQRFLRSVKNGKFVFLFKYLAFLGLRVGEVSKLHISNTDLDK